MIISGRLVSENAQSGRLITGSSWWATPSLTSVNPSIPYLPLETVASGGSGVGKMFVSIDIKIGIYV